MVSSSHNTLTFSPNFPPNFISNHLLIYHLFSPILCLISPTSTYSPHIYSYPFLLWSIFPSHYRFFSNAQNRLHPFMLYCSHCTIITSLILYIRILHCCSPYICSPISFPLPMFYSNHPQYSHCNALKFIPRNIFH